MAGKRIRALVRGVEKEFVVRSAGVGLFFCWFWAVSQDAAVSLVVHPSASPLAFWGTALIAMVVSFLVLAFLCRRFERKGPYVVLSVAAVASMAFYAVALYFPILSGMEASGGLLAVIASGVLSAVLFVCWGMLVGHLGPRQAVTCSGAALLAAFVLVLIFHQFDMRVAGVCFSAVPLLSGFAAKRSLAGLSEGLDGRIDSDAADAMAEDPLCGKGRTGRFLATVFIQGMAFGLLHFLFSTVVMEKCNDPYCVLRFINSLFPAVSVHDFYGVMSVVGLALAGLVVVVGALLLGLNFRKLIYVVGFPLMALGFLIISFDPGLKIAQMTSHASGVNFTAGEVVYMTGFYYAIVVTWALCSFLMQAGKKDGLSLYIETGFVLALGQLVGLALSAVFDFTMASRADSCSVAVFALMITSLVIATNDGLWRDWGDARLNDQDGPGLFLTSCETIARKKGLTPREKEVFVLLARGRSMAVVAESLVVSKDTVKTHGRNIYQKLGVHSQQELIDLVEDEIKLAKDQRMM